LDGIVNIYEITSLVLTKYKSYVELYTYIAFPLRYLRLYCWFILWLKELLLSPNIQPAITREHKL